MGYSATIPFQILTHFNSFQNQITADTTPTDYTLGNFTTPNWKGIPTTAYIDLIIQNIQNTAPGWNNLRNTSGADLAISPDAVTYQSCGAWRDAILGKSGSTSQLCFFRIVGTTNLNTYLTPNTVYYCDARNIKSTADNLNLADMYAELKMVFGV